jgi:PAS domain S-box-containing protein
MVDGSLSAEYLAPRSVPSLDMAADGSVGEKAFRALFDEGPTALEIVGLDFRYEDVNPALCSLLGYSREELLTMGPNQLTLPEDRKRERALFERLREGMITNYQTEKRYVAKDNRVVWVSLTMVLVRSDDGRPRAMVGVVEDITERKREQSALAATDLTFRQLGEMVHVIVYSADPHSAGPWTFVGPQIEALLGYTQEEWKSDPKIWVERLHPADRDRVLQEESRSRETGAPFVSEYRMLARDGHVVWIHDEGTLAWDEDRRAVMMQGLMIDISERRRAEEALRQEERRVRLLRVAAVAANQASSLEEACLSVVSEVCSHTGWPVGHLFMVDEGDDLVSSSVWHLDDPERFEAFRVATDAIRFPARAGIFGSVVAERRPRWLADVTTDLDFARVHVAREVGLRSAFAFPVLAGNQVAGVLEFFSVDTVEPDDALLEVMGDIGTQLGRVVDRNRAERSMQEAIELQHQAVDRLHRVDEMKSGFLTAVSHELRTPLAAVLGYALTLAREDVHLPPVEARDLMQRLAANARKLDRILTDLLDLDRLTHGEMVADRRPTDLAELVAHGVAELVLPPDRSLLNEVSHQMAEVEAAKIERIVENLVWNAVK